MPLAATEKITTGHRERLAYIYVRQSTVRQVQQHRESQVNQYALVERAGALGWSPERIRVIDADLGQSGQDGQRAGFQEVVAEDHDTVFIVAETNDWPHEFYKRLGFEHVEDRADFLLIKAA